MDPQEFVRIARRLMSCPAAPYHEGGVRAVVETLCRERKLRCERDRFGNVIVRVGPDRARRPVVLAAHMDHPGFEVVKQLGPRRWLLEFHGGVADDYFQPGLRLRMFPGGTQAELGRRVGSGLKFLAHLKARLPRHLPHPRYAVWDLKDFGLRRGRIHGRACDDLIGVAATLATLITLQRKHSRVPVWGVISRAEEVGFQGALTVAAGGILPEQALVISLETSRELPPVKMGQGVIVRVGDRSSIFESTATRFLVEVAAQLQKKRPGFGFQRALMPGGTCEATAYQEYGFRTAAVCVALGHYHNCHPRGRIAEEYVSLSDACGMVELLVEAARWLPGSKSLTGRLPLRLQGFLREARHRLRE